MMTTGDTGAQRPGPLLGISLLCLLLVGAACGEREPTGGDRSLTPAEFIDVIVALREAEREVEREVAPDSVAVEFARRRSEILARHGVTADAVREFVERHHRRPGVMSTVWDSIAHRLRTEPSAEPYQLEEGR